MRCGHKGNNPLSQWQDINLMLLAIYEALMRKATTEFMKVSVEVDRSF